MNNNRKQVTIEQIVQNTVSDINVLMEPSVQEAINYVSSLMAVAYSNKAGAVMFTGIGKTSYVADKAAATCKSMGLNGQYLNAAFAGHGDIGQIPRDAPTILVMLSKSGLSNELFELAKTIREAMLPVTIVMLCQATDDQMISIVNKSAGTFDRILRIPVQSDEMDGFGLLPSLSNIVFELCLSSMSMLALQLISVDVHESLLLRLSDTHPSGTLYNKVTGILKEYKPYVTEDKLVRYNAYLQDNPEATESLEQFIDTVYIDPSDYPADNTDADIEDATVIKMNPNA